MENAMRFTNLPQPIAVRLLDLDSRVANLVTEANRLESSVKVARDIVNGKIEVEREEYMKARQGFDAALAQSKAARQRADNELGMLQDIKSWIETLPHNSRLMAVPPATNGNDLATLELQLQSLRQELATLQSITIPADDIGKKVKDYVRGLAAHAQPMLRGYGRGQNLDVYWPTGPDHNPRNGAGYSTIDGNALSFFALLQPEALESVILRAVQSTLPMPKDKLEKRKAELPLEIDELSYTVAHLRDKADMPPDPAMSPHHYLGVRVKEAALEVHV
jgi:hypothetical protein